MTDLSKSIQDFSAMTRPQQFKNKHIRYYLAEQKMEVVIKSNK